MTPDLPVLTVPNAAAWARWLKGQEEKSDGVWLVLAKKGTSKPTNLIYDDALAEALCHGWVDGQLAAATIRRFAGSSRLESPEADGRRGMLRSRQL